MPREVERQSETFSHSPNASRLEDLPDSAYGGSAPQFGDFGQDGYDYSDVSRGEFNHRMRHMNDPDELAAGEEAHAEAVGQDEDTGYNWGPPPEQHHIHDPGFHEDETDLYPFA